jgi:hypothetical protein
VDVVPGRDRQVVVDDQVDRRDVEAAAGDVCGQQQRHRLRLEGVEGGEAVALGLA